MIQVVANDFIKPECVEDFLALAKIIVAKTNELDKGCIKYGMVRDIKDPTHFAMIEEWESQEDLENHMKSAHFQEIIPQMSVMQAKKSEICLFEKAF